jgi:16S rRNA (guanine527-N7)-methyltransferase
MDSARIAALLEPFLEAPLPPPAVEQISIYIDLLLRWNARINLTAIREPEEIVTRHFGESLFLARHLFPSQDAGMPRPSRISGDAPEVIDVGSGAGFPGLPLKIWAPEIRLTLIESNHRKAAFLREVSRALTLTNINVMAARVETTNAAADVVTLRAVERFESVLPMALKLLAPQGRLALLIGSAQLASLSCQPLTWSLPVPIPVSKARVLSIGVLHGRVE